MQRKILIAEDNTELSDMFRNYLLKAGHAVYQAFDGPQTIDMALKLKPDLLVLDIMMPVVDGYEVCRTLRKSLNIPIIVASAKETEEDKLALFELGADDYITKPFSFKEAVSRVNAQLRRYYEFNRRENGDVRRYGALTICPERFEARVMDEPLRLTAKEFKMLDVLSENADRIFSKQQLIDRVWGTDEYIDENTVAVTVARLREKLAERGVNDIQTVWGFGYKWQSRSGDR